MINVRMAEPYEFDIAKDFIKSIFPDALICISDADIVLLAEFQGEKIGFAHLIDDGERMILRGIGVDKSMRGKGIGTMIMDRVLDVANETDRPIYLKVKKMNPAIDFYMKYGFFIKRFGEDVHILVKKPNN